MATKIVKEYSAFYEGIADFPKTGGPASYQLGRSVDHRTDTRSIQLLPKTIKKSGNVVTDLVKWSTTVPLSPYNTYLYGNTGNIYLRDAGINYSLLYKVDHSHGNGLSWYGGDNFVYFTSDSGLGKYGGTGGAGLTPLFYENIYPGQADQTVNTAELLLVSASSQYLEAPSTVANSITGDLSIAVDVHFTAALGAGAVQTLVAKWNPQGNQRSYKLDAVGIDGATFTLRLSISDDGTSVEDLTTTDTYAGAGNWQAIMVTWKASTSTAKFKDLYGALSSTVVGAKTSIFASTAPLAIGAQKDAGGVYIDFLNGLIDNVSVSNVVIALVNYSDYVLQELQGTETGLQACYRLNRSYSDRTFNGNTMVPHGSPDFISTFNSGAVPIVASLYPQGYAVLPERIDLDQKSYSLGTVPSNTYTIPVGMIDGDTANSCFFTPAYNPQASLSIFIDTVGTGSITVTVHDSRHHTIATKTYPNSAMIFAGTFEFVFDSSWNIVPGTTYHFHLTSSVADTKIRVGTAADLSTAWFQTYFTIITTDTQYHPIATMLNMLVVGNGNYVATINSGVYDPNTVQLPFGWKVRCFGFWNEYLAIGAWMGSTVDQFDRGRIFFWDGVALTYNFYIDVPEGAINAMVGSKGQLWFIAGSRCKLMIYEGGARAAKIKNLVNSENENVIDIYPGAMSMWRLLLRFGVAGSSADSIIQEGVYTWGTVNERFPESLSFDYVISTGHYTGTNLHIGMVQPALNKLLIGWQDDTTYGVDEVDVGNDPFATGTVQFLIEDDGAMYHQKEAITVTTQFEPLTSGQSLTLKYRFDRAASFTSLPAITTVGQSTSRDVIATGVKRYREYEVALDLATSSSSSPVVLSVGIEKDVLETEKRVG